MMKLYQASAVGLYKIQINGRRDKHAKLRGGLALDEICKKTMTTNGYIIIDIVWLRGVGSRRRGIDFKTKTR